MPPAYRKQHYLPAVYLKQFSVDGQTATRKSLICRTSREDSLYVTVESQCAQNYHYSRSAPKKVEEFFQDTEGHYGRVAELAWTKQPPAERDYFALILVMFDFHIRNIAYENLTGEENYNAYLRRLGYLRASILSEKPDSVISDAENLAYIKSFWRVELLQPPSGGELVTSDNPSIWCNWDESDQLHCIILPILPQLCAVAFDNRFSHVEFNLTERDTAQLNAWQLLHCWESIYSFSKPSSVQVGAIQSYLRLERRFPGYTDAKSWNMRRVSLSGKSPFDFISKL